MFLGKEVLKLEAFESQQALLERKDPSKTHRHAFRKNIVKNQFFSLLTSNFECSKLRPVATASLCLLCPQTDLNPYI